MSFDRGIQRQIIAAFIATLGAMAMGTILGWSSPTRIIRADSYPFPVTEQDAETYGSVFGVGAVMGAIPAGAVSRVIGRRYGMVLYEVFVITGWACLTVPKAIWMLIVGRILQGIGVGALCTIIPAYVGEISQPHIRGSLGAIFQVLVVVGILYAYVFGSFVKYVPFNILCGVWSVIHAIGVFAIPESPYFLLSKQRDSAAKVAMARLRNETSDETMMELCNIKREIRRKKAQRNTIFSVLSDKANRKSLLIGIGCMFFQQVSGINVVIFYMTFIFNMTGSSTINPLQSSIIVGVVQIIMTFVTMAVVDKVGRRKLLIGSAVLMGLSFAGLATYLIVKDKIVVIDWLPLFFIAVYISAFSLGFGPVPWVVMGEIFSTEVKSYGTSLAISTNWVMVFAVTYSPHEITQLIGINGLFMTYSVFSMLGAIFIWLVFPETKNKSLTEIQSELAGTIETTPVII